MTKQVPAAVAVSRDDKPCERVIVFPDDRSLGNLYSRKADGKRWLRCADARGRVVLDPERRYRLKITRLVYGATDAIRLLDGVDCDQLEEIQASVPIPSKDYWDQAVSGVFYLDEIVVKEQAQLAKALKTTARVVLKSALR